MPGRTLYVSRVMNCYILNNINTQNDLFQIHIKIHIFEVFSRTNQFRITRLSSARCLELLGRFAHLIYNFDFDL